MIARVLRDGSRPALGALLALGLLWPAASSAQWTTREAGSAVEAGTVVDGRLAGLLLRCEGSGGMELALTHNGAVFDREREHTIVVSVDGTATMLPARAVASDRAGDDDFVHRAAPGALEPLLLALGRGRSVEVSAPSGRYTLPLAGSSRAIAAFRESCPGA